MAITNWFVEECNTVIPWLWGGEPGQGSTYRHTIDLFSGFDGPIVSGAIIHGVVQKQVVQKYCDSDISRIKDYKVGDCLMLTPDLSLFLVWSFPAPFVSPPIWHRTIQYFSE